MGLYSGWVITGKIFASEIWEACFRESAYFLGGLLSEFNSVECGQSWLSFSRHCDKVIVTKSVKYMYKPILLF